MWFCCQVIQCNVKNCFAPTEVWKSWSHVVYPSKITSTSKIFSDRTSFEDKKENILLQRQQSSDSGVKQPDLIPEKYEQSCSSDEDVIIDRVKCSSKKMAKFSSACCATSSTTNDDEYSKYSKNKSYRTELDTVMSELEIQSYGDLVTDWKPIKTKEKHYKNNFDEKIQYSLDYEPISTKDGNLDEDIVEYFVDDVKITPSDTYSIQTQYRELWQLRSSIEKEYQAEDIKPSGSRSSIGPSYEANLNVDKNNTETWITKETHHQSCKVPKINSQRSKKELNTQFTSLDQASNFDHASLKESEHLYNKWDTEEKLNSECIEKENETDKKNKLFSVKKRQEISRDSRSSISEDETFSEEHFKSVIFPRYGVPRSLYTNIPQRDYSVDEKSDYLFREFSRCDPAPALDSQSKLSYYRHRSSHRRTDFTFDLPLVHHRSVDSSVDRRYYSSRQHQHNV